MILPLLSRETDPVAGMTRSAAIEAMKDFLPEGITATLLGSNLCELVIVRRAQNNHKQFSYVPLPSIGHEHADAMIRRVMITAPFGCETELRHLADQLNGEQLQPEGGGEGPVLDAWAPTASHANIWDRLKCGQASLPSFFPATTITNRRRP